VSPATGYDRYRAALRTNFYAVWRGISDEADFTDNMFLAIDKFLTLAFEEGAAECGINPDEMLPEERMELTYSISDNVTRVPALYEWLRQRTKADKAKLGDVMKRMELWLNSYNRVKSRAKSLACKDKKLKWVLDPRKESCRDCLNLNGRVYRGSVWARYDLYPQKLELACGGFQCGCVFSPTAEPVTKGRPPRIAGQR